MSNTDGYYSLGASVNKAGGYAGGEETDQGVVSEKISELSLDMKNEDILDLTKTWLKTWNESEEKSNWEELYKEAVRYWRGKQHDVPVTSKNRPIMDNVIFEAVETFLPQVTRRNPDPMVTLSRREKQTAENLAYARELQRELAEIADEMVLRLKLKKGARHWMIYMLGVMKFGWSIDKDMPFVEVVRPPRIILDPNAVNDEDGYSGEYIGLHRKMEAARLIQLVESVGEKGAKKEIEKLIEGEKGKKATGTSIGFIEWWTQSYMCYTLGTQKVLLKKKNPHWNYDRQDPIMIGGIDGEEQLKGENGDPEYNTVEGKNHFLVPKMPFEFLSVYSLGKQPMDDTSLIVQNLANQDLINKRNKQIDKNADSMNSGMVVSLEKSGLNKDQARQVTDALRKGGVVTIPTGRPDDAVKRDSAPSLPADVYRNLDDMRARLRDIFGVRGTSVAGNIQEKTVRGKLQNRALDTDRIGGGFNEYLEQLGDKAYNWFVQLLYVYDDRYSQGEKPKVRISVKEGSLLPKDSLTLAQQAMELAGAGKMALVDLYKALDYPNPMESAANAWLEANAPEMLFKEDQRVQQVLQSRQESANEEPSKSISFKDLPPEGQVQLAKQAGIQLSPEQITQEKVSDINTSIVEEAAKRKISIAEEAARRQIPEPASTGSE